MAHYRAGNHREAIQWLMKVKEKSSEPQVIPLLFLAMALSKCGETQQSRQSYDASVAWMEEKCVDYKAMTRLRAEAEDVLGVQRGAPPRTADANTTAQ
jgi:hypothetical protein